MDKKDGHEIKDTLRLIRDELAQIRQDVGHNRLHLARLETVQRAILERTLYMYDEPISVDELIKRLTGQGAERPESDIEKQLKGKKT